ncbi:hypothetical protein BDW66DRAFT_16662 [Aspergillus desertorum]
MPYYNALIRTHHITSRKKVSALKRAADSLNVFALLRSGGSPGIIYVEGKDKDAVKSWVSVIRNLRYKDFQLVSRPACAMIEEDWVKVQAKGKDDAKREGKPFSGAGLEEVESVKEFGSLMAQRGVWQWWRKGMGYVRGE